MYVPEGVDGITVGSKDDEFCPLGMRVSVAVLLLLREAVSRVTLKPGGLTWAFRTTCPAKLFTLIIRIRGGWKKVLLRGDGRIKVSG